MTGMGIGGKDELQCGEFGRMGHQAYWHGTSVISVTG
jgi:hypothetical protein